MLSFVFVSIDSLQPMLLQENFNINRKEQLDSYKNSLVIAFDIVTKVLTAPFFGILADKLGRKTVNTYGILVIAISMVVMPFCTEFYQYCLCRVFYAQGNFGSIQELSRFRLFPYWQTTFITIARGRVLQSWSS